MNTLKTIEEAAASVRKSANEAVDSAAAAARDAAKAVREASASTTDAARETLYAGLGVVAFAADALTVVRDDASARLRALQQDAEKTFDQLVGEGRAVESRQRQNTVGRTYGSVSTAATRAETEVAKVKGEASKKAEAAGKRVNTAVERVEKRVDTAVERADDEAMEAIARVLHRLNVPTRDDVRTLRASVDRLNAKVDGLRDEIDA